MDDAARSLIGQGDQLFSKRSTLVSLWQTIADHFYTDRADFTSSRTVGMDDEHLMTGYPQMLRRDLGNAFSAMLRPTNLNWFHVKASREEYEDQPAKQWLERASATMRRAMYDRKAQFQRATKEGDHDFAAFGQAVISVEMNRNADGLLYRCWHLRDVAWCENAEGIVDVVHRKWRPTAIDLSLLFPGKIHPKVSEKLQGPNANPYCEINCRHIVIPAMHYRGEYWGKGRRDPLTGEAYPFVSVFIDADNNHVMEVKAMAYMMCVIPRWQTVSGSQYAYSPATRIALPDGRLLQAMTRVLLEAGEKAVNPPMIAIEEAIRSDIGMYAGAITWADAAYDERLGEVLRPLTQDKSGLPLGIEMRNDTMGMLREAFFLNTLTLPQTGPEMTAYEVGQRIQEFIRQATPIFEPMETEYNGGLCDVTFDLMLRAGAFGSLQDIPESIAGDDVTFGFTSPLHDAIEKQKGQQFNEATAIVGQTLPVYPGAASVIDFATAFRDVMNATVPAKWLRSEDEVEAIEEEEAAREQAQALLQDMSAGAQVATQIGEAGQAIEAMPA